MRGDEPDAKRIVDRCRLEFPACAGMNRTACGCPLGRYGVPRMRGDEPAGETIAHEARVPRMRGDEPSPSVVSAKV